MTDQTTKDKIVAALAQLDHSNNDHWTDDGLPRTGVVQKLAGDQTIRRQDINESSPGFARANSEPAEVTGTETGGAPADASAEDAAPGEGSGGGVQGEDVEMTEAEVRAELDQRIVDAQLLLEQARRDVVDSQKREIEAHSVLKNAQRERATRFPPVSPSQNIKSYINAENERRVKEAHARGAYGATAQVDRAAVQGNSRGWKRPTRPALGTNGVMVQPTTRQNMRVLPSQGTRGTAQGTRGAA